MKHLPFLLLGVASLFPIAARAQAPAAPSATAPATVAYEYGTASIQSQFNREWRLVDTDPAHPTSQFYVQDEQGKKRA
ncbi:hypothetical protein HMJ29_18315 [Hymenobacter taeanensis]|uniref:Uncharacterized protein n=1 Tax=Hymenobacter taeanensis TaxID=2735321 RepID=A0A6M6BLQ0_9BACT|nr:MULTISPECIES: hypothetical protein [Hymenobacter]QJX48764.1 hypothetical protein HMJ29_18315 [Hymenobacter taeanensis]UOQ81731.1 hypothetical protein MUN83_02760 [Hymenobacter sp. 5414T-23]